MGHRARFPNDCVYGSKMVQLDSLHGMELDYVSDTRLLPRDRRD